MHTIEPFSNWLKYYDAAADEQSPYFGKEYNYDLYTETVYGYFIDPAWDSFGSETLYLKILYTDYALDFTVLEFIGEWNDAINNDIMELKRSIIELLVQAGIHKFILIGENIMNFHGSDDSYYEEWQSELADTGGWIVGLSFPDHVRQEMQRFQIDRYMQLDEFVIENWRTMHPTQLFERIDRAIQRKLS